VTELTRAESTTVAASPEAVYALISDITRMGEWSPVVEACWWDDGDGPREGAHFTGRNVTPERTWETRCEVVSADGRTFGWVVNDGWVYWGYTVEPDDEGTRLTESWEFRPAGLAGFRERYGEDADAQVQARSRAAAEGIPATLAAIKRTAEGA
jgi:hypothetical protein